MAKEVRSLFMQSVSNLVVTNVVSANRLLHSPVGITAFRRRRDRWAIALKRQGKTVYTAGGKSVTADSLHPVILPCGCDYYWKCFAPGECFFIEFEADTTCGELASFEITDNSLIVDRFSRLEKCLAAKSTCYKQESILYLYEILCFLLKSAKKEPAHPQKHKLLQPALKYISENYFDSGITNSALASLCGISTVYFRKVFESVYGISPIKFLHNFRMEKAKAILHSDFDSIEQVALSVGYNSIYHFSKMFKSYTGQSPTQYAKLTRK